MQIHEIIRTRRTALGLTQEQLAGKLGVSAPAVNKWERGNSYPDITLLPVLARTLRVDLNTLLSFQEDLTETEIAQFLNRLYEVSRTEGCGAAFSLAEEKLRQFPNSDALAYSAAGLLEGLLTLFPDTDETARSGREDFVAGLYERAAQSADPKIREWATYTVASRCIARGELDRAEALLANYSDHNAEWNFLKGAVCYRRGWMDEAKRYYQTACQMDPGNAEYRSALEYMENSGQSAYRPDGGVFGTNACSGNLCAELCCLYLCCNSGGYFFCC